MVNMCENAHVAHVVRLGLERNESRRVDCRHLVGNLFACGGVVRMDVIILKQNPSFSGSGHQPIHSSVYKGSKKRYSIENSLPGVKLEGLILRARMIA